MTQIQESVDVEVPIRMAYNQWTQFETFPEFMSGVESVTQVDDTHNHWVTQVAGVEREFDTLITDQRPDERIAWHSIGGDVRQAGVVTFHRLDESRTRVMIQIDWEPEGALERAGTLAGLDDHQVRADAKRFKTYVATRAHESGAWRGQV